MYKRRKPLVYKLLKLKLLAFFLFFHNLSNMLLNTAIALTTFISTVMASSISPRRYNILDRLSNNGIDVDDIGCKCIMTAPTRQNTDSTMCMCFNRNDGSINDTGKCRSYTGK